MFVGVLNRRDVLAEVREKISGQFIRHKLGGDRRGGGLEQPRGGEQRRFPRTFGQPVIFHETGIAFLVRNGLRGAGDVAHVQPQRIQQHRLAGRTAFDGLLATGLLLISGFHVGDGSLDQGKFFGGLAAGGELRGAGVTKGEDAVETVKTGGGSVVHLFIV